jgi:hypothetical protein
MKKERIVYTSPLDALIAVSKQLSLFENRFQMASEGFMHSYQQGQLTDSADFVEWANAYQHYTALHYQLERQLRAAA